QNLKHKITAIDGTFSYNLILNELEKLYKEGAASTNAAVAVSAPRKTIKARIKVILIPAIARLPFLTPFLPRFILERIKEYNYGQHKTKIITKEQVEAIIQNLSPHFPHIRFATEDHPDGNV